MTTEIETGGPAFPVDNIIARDESGHLVGTEISSGGMTIRDYFAAKAMQAAYFHFSSEAEITTHWTIKGVAEAAYSMADAMLEARK